MESGMSRGADAEAFECGSGTPLVLLHGVGASWKVWKPVLGTLGSRYRVIAPNLPGHPGGVKLGGEPTVAAIADSLIAQLRARGIQSAHVAGNSLGGWVALELARRGFAKSVTALSPAGGWRSPRDYDALRRNLLVPFYLTPFLYVLSWLFMGLGSVRRALSAQIMIHGDRVPLKDFRASLRQFMRTRMMPRLFANQGRIGSIAPLSLNVPTCIAWSEHDAILPFDRYGAPLLEQISGADKVTVLGVGHVPMHDDPEQISMLILKTCSIADRPVAA